MVGPTPDIAAALPLKDVKPREQSDLFRRLVALNDGGEWYSPITDNDPLQGDGWSGLEFVRIDDLSRQRTRAVILTNSCDISSENLRVYSHDIIICPLIKMSRYESLLRKLGKDDEWIASHVASVRNQDITNIFFLPKGGGLDEDSLLRFDAVQSVSIDRFASWPERARLFSLSQQAFWLFLVKLSTHFCRTGEGIARG